MIRLCIIVNTPFALYYFHRGLFGYLRENGVEVTGVAPEGPEHEWLRREGVQTVVVPICRSPSPLKDLASLFFLWRHLMRHRFDIVHVSTPKAGLLGALASLLSGHRRVLFTYRGRVYENATGLKRWGLASLDRLVCALARGVIPISRELGAALVAEGICSARKIHFIGSGSSNGVDAQKYRRSPAVMAAAAEFRETQNIPPDSEIILFVGRLCEEKGVRELVAAYSSLAASCPRVHLVMVGPFESTAVQAEVLQLLKTNSRAHYVPKTREVLPIYAASTVLAFPSYREGFGNVALEAMAMELPVVASNVMGCRESTLDGVTGILVPPRDAPALAAALRDLLDHPDKRLALGARGRERVECEFQPVRIWRGLVAVYRENVDPKAMVEDESAV